MFWKNTETGEIVVINDVHACNEDDVKKRREFFEDVKKGKYEPVTDIIIG